MDAVIAAANTRGEALIALLGDPGYYRRWGFVPAAGAGIAAPDPAWGEHFQVRVSQAHGATPRGAFRYASPFAAL